MFGSFSINRPTLTVYRQYFYTIYCFVIKTRTQIRAVRSFEYPGGEVVQGLLKEKILLSFLSKFPGSSPAPSGSNGPTKIRPQEGLNKWGIEVEIQCLLRL